MRNKILLLLFTLFSLVSQAQSPEQAAYQAVSSFEGLKLDKLPNGAISNGIKQAIKVAAQKVGAVTITDFRTGKADTSAKVLSIRPLNAERYYTYAYVGDTTLSVSDKDGQKDDGVNLLIYGKKQFRRIETSYLPEFFGAKGDGIADDYDAFVRAIAFLKTLNKPVALMLTGHTYNFNGKNLVIDKANISVIANGSIISNGYISQSSTTWGNRFDFIISGIEFRYTSLIRGDGLKGRYGVYIKNIAGGTVAGCTFSNTNVGVYVEPTGWKQGVKTIKILNNNFKASNYGIFLPKVTDSTYATVPEGNNKSTRLVGDMTVSGNEFRGPEIDAINLYGIDGIQMHGNLIFMPNYLNAPGFASKRYNFACTGCTYMNVSGNQFFESGSDGVYLENCDLLIFTGNHIALSGQTILGSNFHMKRTSIQSDGTKLFAGVTFNNNILDGGTFKGIYLEGDYETYGYNFTNNLHRRFAQSGVYYGDQYVLNRIIPQGTERHHLYADRGYNGVLYDGLVDTYYPDSKSVIKGKNGYFKERNTYNNTIVQGTSVMKPGMTDFDAGEDRPSVLENKFPFSAGGGETANWTGSGVVLKDTIFAMGGRGNPNAKVIKVTATTDSVSHHVTTSGVMTVSKVAGDSTAFTFSGLFYAPDNSDRTYIALTIAQNFTSAKGVTIYFNTKTGTIGYTGGTFASGGGMTKDGMFVRPPRITKAEGGFWKIVVSWYPTVSNTSQNVRFTFVSKVQERGSYVFRGTSKSIFFYSDLQLSNTENELPHFETDGTAKARTKISYEAQAVTVPVKKQSGQVGNLLNGSNQISDITHWANGGTVTVTTLNDSLSGIGGRHYKIIPTTTSGQKTVWNAASVKTRGRREDYTASFFGKTGGYSSVYIMMTSTTAGQGAMTWEVDLTTGKLIRSAKIAGTYDYQGAGYDFEIFENGYFRVQMSATVPAEVSNIRLWVYVKSNPDVAGNAAFAGNGTDGVYLHDFQLNRGAVAYQYTPTNGTVTVKTRPMVWNPVATIAGVTNQTVVTTDSLGNYIVGTVQNLCTTCTPKFGRLDITLVNGTLGAGDIASASAAQKKFHFTTNGIRTISYGVNTNENFEVDIFDPTGATRTNAVAVSYNTGSLTAHLGMRASGYAVKAIQTAPTSATATGEAGEVRFTASGIYICIATNTWIKAAAATF